MTKKRVYLLIISIIALNFWGFNFENSQRNTPAPLNMIRSAIELHNPINIPTNGQISDYPGDGSSENPYIIENFHIVGDIAHCIEIHDVSQYVIIRDCMFDVNSYGIYLWCCSNIQIINCTFIGGERAVYTAGNPSSDCRIENSTFINSTYGLYLDSIKKSEIESNSFDECNNGIALYNGATANRLINNIIMTSEGGGITLSGTTVPSNNLIVRNIILTEGLGIFISGTTSSFNIVENNALSVNDDLDGDGLSDIDEVFIYNTNRFLVDTDNDNFFDGFEVHYGSDPLNQLNFPNLNQEQFDLLFHYLDGNMTQIHSLEEWANRNSTLLSNVIVNFEQNVSVIEDIILWLDGNVSCIGELFILTEGNATLLLQTMDILHNNTALIEIIIAIAHSNEEFLQTLNQTLKNNITSLLEVIKNLNLEISDSDFDGLDDLTEILLGTNISCIDSDNDNLNDAFEVHIGTNPLESDSDGDSFIDSVELFAGSDPNNITDIPMNPIDTSNSSSREDLHIPGYSAEFLFGNSFVMLLLMFMKKRKTINCFSN